MFQGPSKTCGPLKSFYCFIDQWNFAYKQTEFWEPAKNYIFRFFCHFFNMILLFLVLGTFYIGSCHFSYRFMWITACLSFNKPTRKERWMADRYTALREVFEEICESFEAMFQQNTLPWMNHCILSEHWSISNSTNHWNRQSITYCMNLWTPKTPILLMFLPGRQKKLLHKYYLCGTSNYVKYLIRNIN